jgi:hypothetical protein
MGHRANFVLIRNAEAKAYYDQWAALGCTYAFAGGPADAISAAEQAEPTTELMDWSFAEAGFLLDFDEKIAIVFGQPEPIDPGEFADLGPEDLAPANEVDLALEQGPLAFLEAIAPRWAGWQLSWDDRGIDAFAGHLARRSITSVATQPKTHPENCVMESFKA